MKEEGFPMRGLTSIQFLVVIKIGLHIELNFCLDAQVN